MPFRAVLCLICVQFVLLGASADEYFKAIRENQIPVLRTLAADKASVNAAGERGVTPLLFAAAFGSPEAVKILLDAGADPLAKNALGATALIWGINSPEKVELLLKKGADVNAATNLGKTPL